MENLIKKIKNLLPFYKSGKQNYKDVIALSNKSDGKQYY